jgi:cation diffusion facilitator CzcD-associated flavoprotein CzcO
MRCQHSSLQQEWDWEEVMAAQPQIHEYQKHVADRFDLRRSILFGTEVTSCTFDDATSLWTVTTSAGQSFVARYVISCVGCLSTPKNPEIPGLEDFTGEVYHTGEWPHEEVDFSGKTVGIIGTGSSGIQSIPVIAEACKHLTVFQRTPQYSLPANNHVADEEYASTMKKNYATLRELARFSPAGFITGFGGRTSATDGTHMPDASMFKILDKTEEERSVLLEEHGFELFRMLADVGMSMEANQVACDLFAQHLQIVIDDPDTAAKLTPTEQPFGCKRQVMDTGYYAAYNRSNVDLVDLRRGGIKGVTETGLSTEQGDVDFDILVLATGYDAMVR